jgi:STE24 endopeptidase
MLVIQRLTERLAPEAGGARRSAGPAVVPAAALAIAVVSFALNIPGNVLSREVERSADGYALELDHDPQALISLQRRLAIRNVSDPDPPGWVTLIFGTHPKTVDRIGYALTWSRER